MQIFRNEPTFTSSFLHRCILVSAFFLASTANVEIQAIETKTVSRFPAQNKVESSALPQVSRFSARDIFQAPRPTKEVVLLHTASGFVPRNLVLDTAHAFELTIVNVNASTKTASFFIDEFGVQQGMPFAETQKVLLRPKQVGKFYVVSPESGFEAQLIVIDTQK
jgi:hypothetical protein